MLDLRGQDSEKSTEENLTFSASSHHRHFVTFKRFSGEAGKRVQLRAYDNYL
jgi:hypothetical protein